MAEANQNTNPNTTPTPAPAPTSNPNPNPSGGEVPPNVTIYINNLNEKIKLEGTSYLSRMFPQTLNSCFTVY